MRKINNLVKTFPIAILLLTSVATKAQEPVTTRPVNVENKVAILPIAYIGDGNAVRMEEMRYRLQNIAFMFLKKEAAELKFQDPAETNALLLKAGVKDFNVREFTPKELAEILRVEYVITGMVTQDITGESTNTNKRRSDNNRRGRETQENSRTVQQMSTSIDLNIYNDKGDKIYGKSRVSILSDFDAYKNGIHYMLKRCPLYKR